MKNLLFFSIILLTSVSALAQLTVKPTAAGVDSYVYVDDQVLFVTDEINLTRNDGSTNTEANIYLRNNAQLVQGNDSALNSGSGQVSVQQNTPVTHAYSYYYWCSPIGSPGPTGAPRAPGNQYFGISQIFEPLPNIGVTNAQRSSTTTNHNGTLAPMTISTRWLYTHPNPGTEAEEDYIRMNTGNNAPPGFGFTMKGVGTTLPGHDQMYEFRGRPNNGEFTIPVAAPILGVPQWTLAGNPYPSSLDLNKLFYDIENPALGTFWYYDEDRTVASHYYSEKPYGYGTYTVGPEDDDNDPYNGNNLGIYAAAPFYIWNSGGGHGGTTGTGSNDQNKRFAPIGQGIVFVGDANGDVKIKNSHRVFFREDTAGSIFQKPGALIDDTVANEENPTPNTQAADIATVAIPDYRAPQMRLWTIFDEAVTRDMLVVFYEQATNGYDRGLDGISPMGMHTDAYFPVGDDNSRKPYVINAVKYDLDKQIPIAFKLKNETKFNIQAVEEIKKPYDNAYLYDLQQQTYQQITGGQSATLNLPAGKYDNRFFIVFRNPNIKRDTPVAGLEAKEAIMKQVNFFQNNPLKQLEIQNPEGYVLKSAAVYDMNGKLVINEKNLGDNNHYSFYTGNLSDGVYLVKLTTSEDIVIDYKAIVHNK